MRPNTQNASFLVTFIAGGSMLLLSACVAAHAPGTCIDGLPTCDSEKAEIDSLLGTEGLAVLGSMALSDTPFVAGPHTAQNMRVIHAVNASRFAVRDEIVNLSAAQNLKAANTPDIAALAPGAIRVLMARRGGSDANAFFSNPIVGSFAGNTFSATNELTSLVHFSDAGKTRVTQIGIQDLRIIFGQDGTVTSFSMSLRLNHGLVKSVRLELAAGELSVMLELQVGTANVTIRADDFFRRLLNGYIYETISIDASDLNMASVGLGRITVEVIVILSSDLFLSSGGYSETGLDFLPHRVAIRALPFQAYVAPQLPALYVSRAQFFYRPEDDSYELQIGFGPSTGPKITVWKLCHPFGCWRTQYQIRSVSGHVRIFRDADGDLHMDPTSHLNYHFYGLFLDHSARLQFEFKPNGNIGIRSARLNRFSAFFMFAAIYFNSEIADILRDFELEL